MNDGVVSRNEGNNDRGSQGNCSEEKPVDIGYISNGAQIYIPKATYQARAIGKDDGMMLYKEDF